MRISDWSSDVCSSDEDGLIGYGGVEGAGADRLLRSFIVVEARRGAGLGSAMLSALERAAADDGATRLYLLTTTAESFFGRFGYARSEEHTSELQSLMRISSAVF